MEKIFWAKSNPKQTIEEHTIDALNCYEKLRGFYPNIFADPDWQLLKDAVLFHDLGKMDIKFLNKILEAIHMPKLEDECPQIEPIPHNVLSCVFLDKEMLKQKYSATGYEILAKAIYYHHHREYTLDEEGRWYISNILPKFKAEFRWGLASLPEKLNTGVYTQVRFRADKTNYEAMLPQYLMIKGILNRIDYTASAGIEHIEESCCDENGIGLYERVKHSLSGKGYKLRPVQEYMVKHKEQNLVVIAATGIGKTEASLLWIGNCKGFYTLPLKVSINAIYERVKRDIGYQPVGLLHSDALSYHLHEQGEPDYVDVLNAYSCAKLLAKPLTITTIDQLFKFVFKYNGGEMSLATLAYSRLIIDEIQMYSKDLVAIILVALKMISGLGGKFSIVTATFPPVLYTFMERIGVDVKRPSQAFHSEYTKRHRIKLLSGKDFDYGQITELGAGKKVLVITNTVKRAQEIYGELSRQGAKVKLLHSSFIKKHRAILENEIMQFATNNAKTRSTEAGIWISTQIVEASLDIDFDVLFTEMCTVDSLLQRLGRIYRSRVYDLGAEPNAFILDGKNGYGNIIDEEIYDFSLAAVKEYDGELLEESDQIDLKQTMINKVYDPIVNKAILKSAYYRDIGEKIDTLLNLPMYEIDKADVKRNFRDIQTITIIPELIYWQLEQAGKIEQWTRSLAETQLPNMQKQIIKDEILQYTISLSHYGAESGVIEHKELIYNKSKIYLYRGQYQFNEEAHNGFGLIRERGKAHSRHTVGAEFI